MRYAVALALLAAVAVGCSSGQPTAEPTTPTPAQPPDPCDLVTPATIGELVGPSLPARSPDACAWRLQADTASAMDDKARPHSRELIVRTSTQCPTASPAGERSVCVDGGAAIVRWEGSDWQDAKAAPFDAARVEDGLDRVEKDVKGRWETAARVPGTTLPEATAAPAAVDACTLVGAATLKAAGIDGKADPTAGSYACEWKVRDDSVLRQLRVLASPQVDREGQRAADWAAMAVRQFAYGWSAPPVDGLGDEAAIVASKGTGQAWVARGPVLVLIEVTATNAPDGATLDWVTRAAKDAVSALPS